jgi:hypothetical protein
LRKVVVVLFYAVVRILKFGVGFQQVLVVLHCATRAVGVGLGH